MENSSEDILKHILSSSSIEELGDLASTKLAEIANNDPLWEKAYSEAISKPDYYYFIQDDPTLKDAVKDYKQALIQLVSKQYQYIHKQALESNNEITPKHTAPFKYFFYQTILSADLLQDSSQFKVVAVGNEGTGKTSSIMTCALGEFPQEPPRVYDQYTLKDASGINVELWDTSGSKDYDRWRPLSYAEAKVFLVFFSVVDPESLKDVHLRWIPELNRLSRGVPMVLVGTCTDLRSNKEVLQKLYNNQEAPITFRQAEKFAKAAGFVSYVEISSRLKYNLKELIEVALKAPLAEDITKGPMTPQECYEKALKYLNSKIPKVRTRGNELLLKCVQEDPTHVKALMCLVKLQMKNDQKEEALQTVNRILTVNKDHLKARLLHCEMMAESGQIDSAVDDLVLAEQSLFANLSATEEQAIAFIREKQYEEAKAAIDDCYEKARKKAPTIAQLFLTFARKVKCFDKLLPSSTRLFKVCKDDSSVLDMHYLCLAFTNNFDQIIKDFENQSYIPQLAQATVLIAQVNQEYKLDDMDTSSDGAIPALAKIWTTARNGNPEDVSELFDCDDVPTAAEVEFPSLVELMANECRKLLSEDQKKALNDLLEKVKYEQ
jgi:small GTP-binding protein